MSGTPRPQGLPRLLSEKGLCQATGINARVITTVHIAQTQDEGVHLVCLVILGFKVIRETAPGEDARDLGFYSRRTADTSDRGTYEIMTVR